MRYYLGLGSNLGDRKTNLARCRGLLDFEHIRMIQASRLYETEPVGLGDQPWFLNQVVEIESSLGPEDLLSCLKALEREMGRTPGRPGGPRLIDIDILLAGKTVVDLPELQVPHPRLPERNFVLQPLLELAPEAVHPVSGTTMRQLWAECKDASKVILYR
jgi:2-amino-4-hydroxy-6-hydroxymethyldihydropteridine diphosphokinase